MNKTEQRRYNAAKVIVKTLSEETSVVAKPLSSIDIKNIPNSVEPSIKNWIRRYKGSSEVYGSSAMATHSIHARAPQDLDIVIDNPKHAALSLAGIMTKRGIKVKLVVDKQWGSYVVQVKNGKGEWADAVDIHPIKDHYGKYDFYGSSQQPLNKSGITLQRASDQLLRKANSITGRQKDGTMGASPHREAKDTSDFIATTELLLASMELKSKAQLAKAKKVRAELKVWKAHLAKLKGGKKKATGKQKPLSATRQKKFVKKAVDTPGKDIDDLIFENGKVTERKVSTAKTKKKAKSPYQKTKKKQKAKKKARKLIDVPKIMGIDEAMKLLR